MEVEARRLLWRCRRGMKELDVLLERFARERYEAAPPEQKRAFVACRRERCCSGFS
jgi:antitoxin CptB